VPGATGDEYRLIVDETGFDFRGHSAEQLSEFMDDFSDTLEILQSEHVVAAWDRWAEYACLDDRALCDFLYQHDRTGTGVSPDVRRRLSVLMDKCRLWDDEEAGRAPETVAVAGQPQEWPSTVGHGLRRTLEGVTTACLLFPTAELPSGWQQVTSETGDTELYFFRAAAETAGFWRALFDREDVQEDAFPDWAAWAFPRLVLADSLSFGKFQGHYRDMRPWVVHVLSVTNDHFAEAVAANAGLPHQVQAALGGHGVTLSPESPKTRANETAMRMRDVEHDKQAYRCEWHAKQHPTHNRVHFSLPDERINGKILIGIFVDHLPT
jgi:hypothetical protein